MKNIILENLTNHNLKSNDYYCYLLIDPSTQEVFYIGKGKRTRFRDHLYPYNSNNHHKNSKIKKIIDAQGHYITRIVYSTPDEQQAYLFEQHLISQHCKLTNKTVGGNDAPTKIPQRVKQYNLYGELIAEHESVLVACDLLDGDLNTSKQILECCRGATPTCKDFYWSWYDSKILRPRTKISPVSQSALTGEYITRYVSLAEAGKCLGIDGRDISSAIKRNGTCAGFKWKYIAILNT